MELILIDYDKDENQSYNYYDHSLYINGICNSKDVNNSCFFSYNETLDWFISDDTLFNFLNYIKKQLKKDKIKVNDKVLKEYFSIEEHKDKNQNSIISIEIKQPDFFNQWLKSLENKDKYTKRKEVYTIDKHGFLKSVKIYNTYIVNGLVSDEDTQIKIEGTTTKHFSNVDNNIDLKAKEPYSKYYNES